MTIKPIRRAAKLARHLSDGWLLLRCAAVYAWCAAGDRRRRRRSWGDA
jgi:hypothetical protein